MRTSLATLMLERCAETIEQVIIPNVTGGFPAAQAEATARVLRLLAPAMREKSRELAEENDAMREVLRGVLEALRSEKSLARNVVRNRLMETLKYQLKKVAAKPLDVVEDNYNLKGALVETIKGLDTLTDALPTETMSSLRRQIRSVLRQQLNHNLTGFDLFIGGREDS